MGIEPTSSAWKAEVLPLNYTRHDCLTIAAQKYFANSLVHFSIAIFQFAVNN
jgi:hypothetical protein